MEKVTEVVAALIRECREELAVELETGEPFLEVTHTYPDLTIHLTVFEAKIAAGRPRLLEHAAMQWILPSETDGYAFCPADVPILEKLKKA